MDMNSKLEEYEKELSAKDLAKDYEGKAILLNTISYIYRTMGNWKQSVECLNTALAVAENHSDLAKGVILCSLGALYIEKAEIRTAINYLNDSLRYVEMTKNYTKIASAYGNLGKAHFFLGRWNEAVNCVKKALKIGKKEKLVSNIMSSYTLLGKIESERGNFLKANEYFTKGEELCVKILETTKRAKDEEKDFTNKEHAIRDIVHICELYIAEAVLFRYQNKIENAIKKASEAKGLAQQISYTYGEIDALLEISKCYIKKSDSSKRENLIKEAIQESKKLGAKAQEAEAKLQYAIVLANEGNLDNAQRVFEESARIFNEIENQYAFNAANVYKGIFLFDRSLNKKEALSVLTGLQKNRELGKVTENIELIQRLHMFFENITRCVEKDVIDILNHAHSDLKINQMTEKDVQQALKGELSQQSRIIDLLSYLRIIERNCSLVHGLSTNLDLKNKSQYINSTVVYLIEVSEAINDIFKQRTALLENNLNEYKQDLEFRKNILLQILQATLAGTGVTGIITTILSKSESTFTLVHFVVLGLTFVSWGMLPTAVYMILDHTKHKKVKWLLIVGSILLIVISLGLFIGILLKHK